MASTQACIIDSDPQHPYRRPGAVEGVYNLNTREEETGKIPGANWPNSLAGLVSSKFSEKVSKKKKNSWRVLERHSASTSELHTHARVCTHPHKCLDTYMPSTQTQRIKVGKEEKRIM